MVGISLSRNVSPSLCLFFLNLNFNLDLVPAVSRLDCRNIIRPLSIGTSKAKIEG